MSDPQETNAAVAFSARQKSLELLFEYTKFHIGLYLTLTGTFIAVATAKIGEKPILTLRWEPLFWIAVASFVVAGLAGGVIASSITQTSARNSAEFLETKIGPWNMRYEHDWFRARYWACLEHTAFWIGLVAAIFTFKLK